jgi:hypothetical protein
MFRGIGIMLITLGVGAAAPAREPILVELFTSEGCSSCPPADRLLVTLDSQVIVLGEHVDYWDHQGWRDPWSSHANTLRQESYARHFGQQGPYTPQMVIDGRVEFNGSEAGRAADEINRARAREKSPIRLERTPRGIDISIDPIAHSAHVIVAIAQPSGESQVAAGENNGRRLQHVAMVKSLLKVGSVKKGAPFHQKVELPADTASFRIIVFLQEPDLGPVYGVAMLDH